MRATMLGGMATLAMSLFLALSGAFTPETPVASASAAGANCSRSISGSGNPDSVVIKIKQSCSTYYRAVGLWGGGSYDGYHYGTYHGTGWHSTACANSGCTAGTVQWGGYERKSDGKEWCFYLCANAPAAVIGSTAITTMAFPATPQPHPGHPSGSSKLRRNSNFDYQDHEFSQNWRDPSSGGSGTIILASTPSDSNAEDWALQANGTCGGTVTAGCPGGWWSNNLVGFDIVTLRNIGQGSLCFGANAQNSWIAKMFTCDGVNGVHHYDTLYAWDPNAFCGSTVDISFYSYQWNANGNNNPAFIADTGGSGFAMSVVQGTNLPHCFDALFRQLGS